MDNPADPLNQHADQIRALAQEYDVGLADSFAAFQAYSEDQEPLGKKQLKKERLEQLMTQVNHPNRKGHDLVAERLLEWFPESIKNDD